MALQNSGQISINDVSVELGTSGKRQLAETTSRGLCDVASGQVKLSDFYGKSDILFTDATGGNITTNGNFKIHTFTSSGSFVVNTAGTDDTIEYLVVGGGGGGGMGNTGTTGTGGGGDAGGFNTGSFVTTSGTSYSITVGEGGDDIANVANSGVFAGSAGNAGNSSTAFGITSAGGSGGVSTGGGGANGGDGASGAGDSSLSQGGDGLQSDITGTNLYYAGGGGGSRQGGGFTAGMGLGGQGGGAQGGIAIFPNFRYLGPGQDGLGGGGGGTVGTFTSLGGNSAGGDGVVIIKYKFQ
jgi:hypothetical protein